MFSDSFHEEGGYNPARTEATYTQNFLIPYNTTNLTILRTVVGYSTSTVSLRCFAVQNWTQTSFQFSFITAQTNGCSWTSYGY